MWHDTEWEDPTFSFGGIGSLVRWQRATALDSDWLVAPASGPSKWTTSGSNGRMRPMEYVRMLFSFEQPDDAQNWLSVDDVVMGGVSASRLAVTPDSLAVFSGSVSLANNGGFASIRTRPRHVDLAGYDGLEMRVRGDGKRYRLRLRTDASFDGIAYQAGFDTQPDTWQTLRFPFSVFQPTFRGWTVPDAPALDPGQIHAFGLMIADKQAGPFRLEVDWLRAFLERSGGEP
jgi:NADH dehydrogenase [ubiquinone] 1 alpha subcomplex assembly factor 1